MEPVNCLTVDVEDFFQVAAFRDIIAPQSWEKFPCRVERNTGKIFDLFDAFNVKATFFFVGWIAEQFPDLVKETVRRGHEIGCHSYWHQKVYDLNKEEFRRDTQRAKEILEQLSGTPILGYRAPTYSITAKSLWALEILEDLGFQYDSSIFPVVHDNYGIPGSPRFPYSLEGLHLKEFPISTLLVMNKAIPVSGGGYFRLFPYAFTKWALSRINRVEQKSFVFYFHPWELDPDQPRVEGASVKSKIRHYLNLDKTEERLRCLLHDFSFCPMGSFFNVNTTELPHFSFAT